MIDGDVSLECHVNVSAEMDVETTQKRADVFAQNGLNHTCSLQAPKWHGKHSTSIHCLMCGSIFVSCLEMRFTRAFVRPDSANSLRKMNK